MAEAPVGHPRKFIRAALKTLLDTGAIVPAGHVFKNRVRPAKLPELPLIAIYTTDEPIDDDSKGTSPVVLRRVPSIAVEVLVKAVDDADDVLDDLCWKIERAIALNDTLGGLVASVILANTQIDLWTEAGQLLYISATLTLELEYDTDWPSAEDQPLTDFQSVQATVNLGNAQHAGNQQVTQFTVHEPEP